MATGRDSDDIGARSGLLNAWAAPQFDTKGTWVANALRNAITSGEFKPGQRLVMDDLARRMRLSVTPLREALSQLQAEGLVVIEAHRGARVSDVPLARVEEIVSIRLALELLAVRQSIAGVTPEIIDRLEAIVEETNQAIAREDPTWFVEVNRRFHMTLYESTEMPTLMAMISMLWSRMPWGTLLSGPDYADAVIHDHGDVVAALRAGDYRKARAEMEKHLQSFARRLRDTLAQRLKEADDASSASGRQKRRALYR